jgi:hypothetical protein
MIAAPSRRSDSSGEQSEQPPVENRYTLPPHVLWIDAEDGTGRLLNLDGDVYALDRNGAYLLKTLLSEGLHRAIRSVATDCAVPPERVERDLASFIADLERLGLLTNANASGGRRERPTCFSNVVLGLLLRLIRSAVRSPTVRAWTLLPLTKTSLRCLGWSRTISVIEGSFSGASAEGTNAATQSEASSIGKMVSDVASKHFVRAECKERGVTCWTLLRWSGIPADLVIGVDLGPFNGHCWCESSAGVLADDSERCRRYRPVYRRAGG